MVSIDKNGRYDEDNKINELQQEFENDGWETLRHEEDITFVKNGVYIGVDPDGSVYIMDMNEYEEIKRMG